MVITRKNGKKSKYTLFERMILCILLLIPVVFLILYIAGNMGVARKKVEKDARDAHRIEADWQVAKDGSDRIEAMIFYDEKKTDYTMSIYVRKDRLSVREDGLPLFDKAKIGIAESILDNYGFFFRMGGGLLNWNEEITEIKVADYGYVIASMNDIGVASLEIYDNGEERVIEVDSGEPFIAAVTENASIRFYDAEGQLLEVWSQT
ncbi:MAG: hypothetical protein IJZ85_11780 [Lachnospiraceae bacterium]|nr:hypothetical protein [Lachnospiraceae bacterium]